jgi:hypothetical protein
MAVVRIHGYTVEPTDLEELLARRATLAAVPSFPEARAAMSLTRDATAEDGELVDER